jgi:hypothetical protein
MEEPVRILLVDDEINVLRSLERGSLRVGKGWKES